MNEESSGALVVAHESSSHPSIIRAASSADVALAISEYQRIQSALDQALPDCIMKIQGKSFRKKNYWRAVATAFNLHVEQVSEQRVDDGDDWGITVTYVARAQNGRTATGDGACSASEKAERQRTLHNVRSHAHTRAYNRAVSNLVGFGEVSAEEIHIMGESADESADRRPRVSPRQSSASPPTPAEKAVGPQESKQRRPAYEGEPLWLDEKLGFGKYEKKTWRDFLDAKGQGLSYIEWLAREAKDEKARIRASTIIDLRASQ